MDVTMVTSNTETQSSIRSEMIEEMMIEYLNLPETSLETRSYLLETTLPILVLALEKLLIQLPFKNTLKDEIQRDKPYKEFDVMNWLAQFLYRNSHKSEYQVKANEIAVKLKERMAHVALERQAQKEAEELKIKLEKERIDQERIARLFEIGSEFEELLGLVFRTWIQNLWRKSPGELFRFEILQGIKQVMETVEIQADPLLLMKIKSLEVYVSTGGGVPDIHLENMIVDPNDDFYTINVSTIERWDLIFFQKAMLRVLVDWSRADLTTFLRVLSSIITSKGVTLYATFQETLFIPKFGKVSIVRDWLQQLLSVIKLMELPNKITAEAIKKACLTFCMGREEPRFTFVANQLVPDETMENDNPAVSYAETAYVRFLKCIFGEFGASDFQQLMEHVKNESLRDRILLEKLEDKSEVVVENGVSEEMHFRIVGLMKKVVSGNVELEYISSIIQQGIITYKQDTEKLKVLTLMHSLVAAKGQVTADSLALIVEKVVGHVDDAANELAQLLVELHTTRQLQTTQEREIGEKQAKEVQDRMVFENETMDQVRALQNTCLSVRNVSQKCMQIILDFLQKVYPEAVIYGRISLTELGVTKTINDAKLGENDTVAGNGIMESYLRVVAVSMNVGEWLGRIIAPDEGIDTQMMYLKQPIKLNNLSTDSKFDSELLFKDAEFAPSRDQFSFLGAPLATMNQVLGCMDCFIKNVTLQHQDLKFLQLLSPLISTCLEIANQRQQMVMIASKAKEYIQFRTEKEVGIVLQVPDVGACQLRAVKSDGVLVNAYGSPWFHEEYELVKVEQDDATAVNVQKLLQGEEIQGYIPIMNPEGICVGCIVSPDITADETSTFHTFGKLIGLGMKESESAPFVPKAEDFELESEKVDEYSRRLIKFGKVVLHAARKELSELDQAALAELKSYKKPPKSIHRIMKGTLYLFGHQPTSLKQWLDTVKLVNADLIKSMVLFDPTAVHKKIRFKRAKRIMKLISWGESRPKSSKPAQVFCDWLAATLVLRQMALASRKARPDLYERVQTADSDITVDEEVDEDEFEQESVEIVDDQGNAIEQIDLSQ